MQPTRTRAAVIGVSEERIRQLEDWVCGDCRPDLTLLFDVPPAVSRERLAHNARDGRVLDKFEREETSFFERVRAMYLQRARSEPGRFRVVDSTRPLAAVREELAKILEAIG